MTGTARPEMMKKTSRALLHIAAAPLGGPHVIALLRMVTHLRWLERLWQVPSPTFVAWPPRTPDESDIRLCTRLRDAYRRSDPVDAGPLWATILRTHAGGLLDALESGSPHELAELLARMFREPFMWGSSWGDLWRILRAPVPRRFWSLKVLDDLVSLAEAAGVVRAENPKHGPVGAALADLDALVGSIEDAGIGALGAPNIGAPYGWLIGQRLITPELPEHAYAAWRGAAALDRCVYGAARIMEIGGGFGGTALRLLGLRPAIAAYTIVDLPLVGVLQGYYLSKALGPGAVSLYGEPPATVRIVPPEALEEIGPVDLLLNQNSLPEMPPETVRQYLDWARANVQGLIYSYNQEAQTLVPELAAAVGLHRLSREQSWLRRGYVEETYHG
jgi:hypothetical protein